jgi:hypothetical protein
VWSDVWTGVRTPLWQCLPSYLVRIFSKENLLCNGEASSWTLISLVQGWGVLNMQVLKEDKRFSGNSEIEVLNIIWLKTWSNKGQYGLQIIGKTWQSENKFIPRKILTHKFLNFQTLNTNRNLWCANWSDRPAVDSDSVQYIFLLGGVNPPSGENWL